MKVIEFENIKFKYPKSKPLFKDLNISFEDKEFTFILGPNGCGKSSLLKLLLAEFLPQNGQIKIRNKPADTINLPAHLGYIPQSYSIDNEMFVDDTINFMASLHGIYGINLKERKKELVEAFDIEHLLSKKIKSLSGGQKQIINILIGIIHNPDVILLDEPFVGLDYQVKAKVLSVLSSLEKTKLCVTHDMDIAEQYADTVVLMSNGEVLEKNSSENLVKNQPYALYEINYKGEIDMSLLASSDKIYQSNQHHTMTISFPENEKSELLVNQFLNQHEKQITSVKVDKNSLKSTIIGLHKLDLSQKTAQKKGRGKNK